MIDDLDLIDDLTPPMTRDDVEARVNDWKKRLNTLFQDIGAWAKNEGWRVTADTMSMDEELMRKFGVPETDLPVLRLDRDDRYALFTPKALWVIGANGRVDLYTSKGLYVIIDRADPGVSPQWTIFRASKKRNGDLFVPELISRLV